MKETARCVQCYCPFGRQFRNTGQKLTMLFLCDLEFPLVGLSHRHRVGDVHKYFVAFLSMRNGISSLKSEQDEALAEMAAGSGFPVS